MKRWRIENRAGQILLEHDAATKAAALDAMAIAAGYSDYEDACRSTDTYDDLDVVEIEMLICDFCGMKFSLGEEVIFAGQKCALCGRGTLESKGGGS